MAFGQLSLEKAAEEPLLGWMRVHTAVGEATLLGAWLGMDEGEEPWWTPGLAPSPPGAQWGCGLSLGGAGGLQTSHACLAYRPSGAWTPEWEQDSLSQQPRGPH